MTELNNITVTHLDDGMVSLLIDQQPISEKYGTKFEASIVDDIKALENAQKLKLFEQFVFSHQDLNFEHAYYYVTGIVWPSILFIALKLKVSQKSNMSSAIRAKP